MTRLISIHDGCMEKRARNILTRDINKDSENLADNLIEKIELFYKQGSLTYKTISDILAKLSFAYDEKFMETLRNFTKIFKHKVEEKNNGKGE